MKMLHLALLLAIGPGAAQAAPTRVYLVRHAEKQTEPASKDPPLTAAGEKRAQTLARVLRSAGVQALYATELMRTQQTLAPLEKALGLKIRVMEAKKTAELAAEIKAQHKGQVLAVAGHSNTLPDILRALGVEKAPEIGDADYDNLFVVIIDEAGKSTLLGLHYGDGT